MRKALLCVTLAVIFMGGATPVMAAGKDADYSDKMFEAKDANSDGVISKAEFLEHSEKKFARMDADGNEEITQEEIDSLKAEIKEKPDGKDSSGRGSKMLKRADANSDGVISKTEFLEHSEKKFAKIDADGNEEITQEELSNRRSHLKEKLEKLEKFREKRKQRRGH